MLLAFARTVLLQPGDHTTVCMPVDLADLRLMGAGGERFTLQAGRYQLAIGGASPGPAVRLGCLFVVVLLWSDVALDAGAIRWL